MVLGQLGDQFSPGEVRADTARFGVVDVVFFFFWLENFEARAQIASLRQTLDIFELRGGGFRVLFARAAQDIIVAGAGAHYFVCV